MHKKTWEIIQDAYIRATTRSSEYVIDVYEALIDELTHCNFSDDDAAAVDYFINGLKAGINCRLMEDDYSAIMHDIAVDGYLDSTKYKSHCLLNAEPQGIYDLLKASADEWGAKNS